MKIRALPLVLAAIALTAACSPESSLGPTGSSSGATTTVTSDKRTTSDSTDASCSGSAFTNGKRSCDANHWNGSTGKR